MKSYSSSQSGSGSRRGSRNRSGRSSGDRRANGSRPAPAPTFWQKIASFFKGGGKKSAVVRPSGSEPTAPRSNDDSDSPRQRPSSSSGRTVRKPEAVEVTSPRLYVGNLSFDATENDLSELFNGVGQVVTAEVVSHKQTQRSKGFAFVQMQTVEEAKRAVTELHDKDFMGRKLVVSGAKSAEDHDSRSEPRFAA